MRPFEWKNSILHSVAALVATFALADARGGVDSVRLDPVPIDARVNCNRTFFRSSQRQQGTIYVMPRATVGTKAMASLIDIIPNEDSTYRLEVGIYFPRDDEHVKKRMERRNIDEGRCNFDEVLHFLNKNEPANAKTKTIARMPLTSIQVSIPGVSQPFTIGRFSDSSDEVDILNYYGASYTTEFRLTEAEKDIVVSRLSRRQGLEFNVKFRFEARRFDGSITAEVNWSDLATGLQADASSKGLKKIAAPELKAMLSTQVNNSSVKITSEQASSDSFQKIADRIVEQALIHKDVFETPKNESGGKDSSGGSLIDIKAFVQFLYRQSSRTLQYEQVGRPETATAATTFRIHEPLYDPRVRQVEVISGEDDPVLPEFIKRGQTIRIAPGYTYTTEVRFREARSYLTPGQIAEMQLAKHFPTLANKNMVLSTTERNDGTLMAVGRWYPWPAWAPTDYVTATYAWIRIEKKPYEVHSPTVRVYEKGVSLETLRELPISISFSTLGRKLTHLADLMEENENWSARYTKHGTIVLTAKRDLGQMTINESWREDRGDFTVQDVASEEVIEETTYPIKGVVNSEPVALQHHFRFKIKTKSLVINLSRPRFELDQEPRP